MHSVITAVGGFVSGAVAGFIAGAVVTYIYGAWAKAKLKSENDALKAAAQRTLGKL